MDNKVYIEGIGWCLEITENRKNKDGVNEPCNIYVPIEKR